jgi:hypothetical protein
LIAGVNATYALGFVEILMKSLAGPRGGLEGVLKKLAKRSVRHWFTCATGKNLRDPKVAFAVKETIARNFGTPFREMLEGIAIDSGARKFFAHTKTMSRRTS